MSGRIKVGIALLFIGSCLMIPALAFLQQQENLTESMPEGEGARTVKAVCVTCHTLDTVLTRNKTRQNWQSTVTDIALQHHAAHRHPVSSDAELLGLNDHSVREATCELTERPEDQPALLAAYVYTAAHVPLEAASDE